MARPGILCKLQKGTLIDAQPNFVDTFNWLVEFVENLKGEGEVNPARSRIVIDRTDTARPVIRSQGVQQEVREILRPWEFSCVVEVDENGYPVSRAGGWERPRVQFGYQTKPSAISVTGLDQTDDGEYYLKCDVKNETFELVNVGVGSNPPPNEYEKDLFYVWIGTVDQAKQTDGIYQAPVIYVYV